jgi:hypothetical protein
MTTAAKTEAFRERVRGFIAGPVIPLPFVATLAVRRHLAAPPGPADRLAYAVAEPQANRKPLRALPVIWLKTSGIARGGWDPPPLMVGA